MTWMPVDAGPAATIPRRAAGFVLDLLVSWLVAMAMASHVVDGVRVPYWWASTSVYLAECVVLLALTGQTFGMRLVGLRVVGVDGSRLAPWRCLVRTLVTLLFVPMFFFGRDLRGAHDRVAGSTVVRVVRR